MLAKSTYRALKRLRSYEALQAFLKAQKPAVRRAKKAAGARKEEKRAAHRAGTAAIREAVLARAEGRCEAGSAHTCSGPLEMDHWLGGNGRRRQRQSVQTCWMLCQWHHKLRTIHAQRDGDTLTPWNERFAAHCRKYGYSFTPHIEHAKILRPAQGKEA